MPHRNRQYVEYPTTLRFQAQFTLIGDKSALWRQKWPVTLFGELWFQEDIHMITPSHLSYDSFLFSPGAVQV